MRPAEAFCPAVKYEEGNQKRIQHFLKVYGYCELICVVEGIHGKTKDIIEIAGLMHDIGIKVSREKYGSSAGHYQELEGPSIARNMLEELGYDESVIERVCYLIAHHHTYNNIDGIDYQILVEADLLVNFAEKQTSAENIKKARDKVFKTKTGIKLLGETFLN